MKEVNEEIWRPVVGYEKRYEVSNFGNIRGKDRIIFCKNGSHRTHVGVILAGSIDKHGYYLIALQHDSGRKTFLLHRLIATAFIPNPDNLPCVNHKNGIKTDNRVENLEWCTVQENCIHAIKHDLYRHHSRQVCAYDLDGNFIKEFNKLQDASVYFGGKKRSIGVSRVCSNQRPTYLGHVFKYKPCN